MEQKNDTLTRYYAKKKKRKKRRKYAFYTLLTVFFVLVITVLSLTVFFNINDIAVTGNAYYSAEEIIAVSGLEKGQNLFKLNKFKVINTIKQQMPYLANVEIDRHLPVGIEIKVEETSAYMYLSADGEYYILDETLKLLEITETEPEGLPEVIGLSPENAVIGEKISAENGEDTRLAALTVAAKENIGDGCLTSIDVTASYDVSFEYLDRITVKVGTVDNIVNKLKLVKYVIDENRSTEEAVIDVTDGKYAYYRSVDRNAEDEAEPEQETEQQTEVE